MKERDRRAGERERERERERARPTLTRLRDTPNSQTQGDTVALQLEDDIRSDLAKIGIKVNLVALEKDDLNLAMTSGNFNMAFSETWGPPYGESCVIKGCDRRPSTTNTTPRVYVDPQSFAKSWSSPNEGYYAALKGLPAPKTYDVVNQLISNVLEQMNGTARAEEWENILSILHYAGTEIPISSKSIPAVFNKRLFGYIAGDQQYQYDVSSLRVQSGNR